MATYNLRNPAVKRILQEVKELERGDNSDFIAHALEDNIFEWHFVVRGPSGTPFEGGIYHGRILLPPEYPMKPPSFMMLTPNGRFQTSTKICLSISSHHPEHWQPSWSVRTALTALTAFMPTPGNGAIGSLDLPAADRVQLAAESRSFVPKFGNQERQALNAEMHQRMLDIDAEVSAKEKAAADAAAAAKGGEDNAEEAVANSESPAGSAAEEETPGEDPAQQPSTDHPAPPAAKPNADEPLTAEPLAPVSSEQPPKACAQPESPPPPEPVRVTQPALQPAAHTWAAQAVPRSPATVTMDQASAEDKGLSWLAGALSVAIAALLLRKLFVFFDVSVDELLNM
mmetsp:Transcript_18869/g.52637  ORF Transcript_18869/g.52637 Transcript_18869/m.52637 type:complete len:342 (-) Transcript_18869:319-1344(-)|eukprot:CAMPEP_0117669808 /NCGR_PEP_ID=MMETSP0804-20121206/12357_1 /TAXON_ID=1074897 /ORGANISM="Tetraselmis astigmatica, Strain CCMP880" /LENGTH=341 /DNA_ID=CAMNT_0005477945 /DNA_START=536 /DNA_END=1561 /DNA_ORIENTATION=-